MAETTVIDDPMGIECIGGPYDGRRIRAKVRPSQIGSPERVGESVYVWDWWPHFDEDGYEVGASKVLCFPGATMPTRPRR